MSCLDLQVKRALPAAAIIVLLGSESVFGRGPDFNGDGRDDLAVGVPFEQLSGINSAGAVNVIYGSGVGLNSAGDQIWHQNSPGIGNEAESGDQFGHQPTWGDFNGDGFDDLAVGIPFENIGSIGNAGAVSVIYGSASGLTAQGDAFWHQNREGMAHAAEPGDLFGFSLTSGDFNGDGFADLAIGVPNEDLSYVANAGAVAVLYGSATGLVSAGDQFWHRESPGVLLAAGAGDHFGFALTAADFDGDGRDDLAIGVPEEDMHPAVNDGAVNVLYGSDVGLSAEGNQLWSQYSPGLPNDGEDSDTFGFSLTSGDFNGDGLADLVVGAPFETVGGAFIAGAVTVIYGSAGGLTGEGSQEWTQANLEVESPELADLFGWSLAAGDFDGDGFDELVVGAPLESVESVLLAGAAIVIHGSPQGLVSLDAEIWHQDSPDVAGVVEEQEWLGASLMPGDYNGDGALDLALGVPFEDVGGHEDAGAVVILYNNGTRLTGFGSQIWHQNSPGIQDQCESNEGFSFGNQL